MDTQTFNMIIGIGLVVALSVFGIVQIVGLIVGHPVSWVEGMIVALVGLLQAFRHAGDVKNGNGSSGTTPPANPPQ